MRNQANNYSLAELALAYELRQEGCCWKRIAAGVGGDHNALKHAVSRLVVDGFSAGSTSGQLKSGRPFSVSKEKTMMAEEMRSHGLGWRCIAEYLGESYSRIRRSHERAKRFGIIKPS